MPELPEVETLARALKQSIMGMQGGAPTFFRDDLRDPIPKKEISQVFRGQAIVDITRRSKYLMVQTTGGWLGIHLGMTGNLRLVEEKKPQWNHTHAIFPLTDSGHQHYLHYIDPRRFGRLFAIRQEDYQHHPFFHHLGAEPLATKQLGRYLYTQSRRRKGAVKSFLMDNKVIVGVGNIYASEALFRAAIHPETPSERIDLEAYKRLATAIRTTLNAAIAAGGTTFRDFKSTDGEPGYFAIRLQVYGREGDACPQCTHTIQTVRLSGRSTFFCPSCQPTIPH